MNRPANHRLDRAEKHRAHANACRIEALAELCRRHGLPLTVQRRFVLQTLLDLGDHPTADEVYVKARRRLPGISRTTVYRVLDALVELGAIGKACTPGSAARYDAGTHRHHHLICTRCDRVMDLDVPVLELPTMPNVRRLGFRISDYSIHFKGICAECVGEPNPRQSRATKRRGSADRGR